MASRTNKDKNVKVKKIGDRNTESMEKLSEEIHQVERAFLQKGLTGKQIQGELLKHIRDKKLVKSLSSNSTKSSKYKTLMLYLIPVILAILVGLVFMYKEDISDTLKTTSCLVEPNVLLAEISRPLQDCSQCAGMKQVHVVKDITKEDFLKKYAYTDIPVLIKDATKNWTAMENFNLEYFKKIYTAKEETLDIIDRDCQFFGYKTEFDSLGDALAMSRDRADYKPGELPWYFGWSNCDPDISKELRKHYSRPYFLPEDSESSNVDWIFMGGPGPGAFIHLDFVQRPSWQAQISGTKTWTLIPAPECENICHSFDVTVQTGDIIVLDTNQWYHATHIHPGKLSITIGSEYD